MHALGAFIGLLVIVGAAVLLVLPNFFRRYPRRQEPDHQRSDQQWERS